MMKVAAVERRETNITAASSRDDDSQTADSAVTADSGYTYHRLPQPVYWKQ